jgi:hypothetical protein
MAATVKLEVVTTRLGGYGDESTSTTLQSDQDGKFELSGVTGYCVNITTIEKEGYQLSPKTERCYVFGFVPHYKPDPANPVVFKMWKLAGKEPLVGSAWHGKVACDGTTNRFDLYTGKPNADGNLEIMCKRVSVASAPHGHGEFDLTFEVAVLGGGIQPTDDEFTYRPLETGYAPTFTVDQKADAPKWRPDVNQEFYIKTPDGRYGRLHVDWDAWQTPPTHLEWDCSINPSGSRNLER